MEGDKVETAEGCKAENMKAKLVSVADKEVLGIT
jgi:hypothetical protein